MDKYDIFHGITVHQVFQSLTDLSVDLKGMQCIELNWDELNAMKYMVREESKWLKLKDEEGKN